MDKLLSSFSGDGNIENFRKASKSDMDERECFDLFASDRVTQSMRQPIVSSNKRIGPGQLVITDKISIDPSVKKNRADALAEKRRKRREAGTGTRGTKKRKRNPNFGDKSKKS